MATRVAQRQFRRIRNRLALALVLALVAAGAVAWLMLPRDHGPTLHADPASFRAVLAKAQGGDTIVLGAGDYGRFAGAAKPSTVTIRADRAATARMSLAFTRAANLRLEGLTIGGADIGGTTHDVTIAKSTFTQQVVIHAEHMRNARVVLDGNRLPRIDACADCYEGRVHVLGNVGAPSGVVIANNVLGPGGNSDGIQVSADGVRIVGNTFVGIFGRDGRHVDALQLYGASHTLVRGNYFRDVASAIMAPDGADHERIEDNVFDTGGYPYAIMLGGDDGSVIRHNTVPDVGRCAYGQTCGTLLIGDGGQSHQPGKGTVVADNILGSLSVAGASAVRSTHNLVAHGGGSPDDKAGVPAFVGGAHPRSRAGFRLKDGSPGRDAASDGRDVGSGGG
jgi:Right handed beta helix region